MMQTDDTICALSTPQGMGAIAVIRVSGPATFPVLERFFRPAGQRHALATAKPYTLIYGTLYEQEERVDEVMIGVYRAPKSYTGQDVAEISCHGSVYIQERIVRMLLSAGVRMAEPGEYTLRAFFNGKMDLSQAEGVADLIASESEAAHRVAYQQMRGGISEEIRGLREELIQFASLVELELDFTEEDVEFADKAQLTQLVEKIQQVVQRLLESYGTGNVIKNGVPVAIVGAPNAGKSTLLNALVQEERAIVTEVAGTTRDAIEDEVNLGGVKFRFIDTAGIRETEDVVEKIGIRKTYEKIAQSRVVLYLFDAGRLQENAPLVREEIAALRAKVAGQKLLLLANKIDQAQREEVDRLLANPEELLYLSALEGEGLEALIEALQASVNLSALESNQNIVTSARHYEALRQSQEDLARVAEGLAEGRSGDLLALDIREALRHLGAIIGEVDVDRDILGAIFGKFCIGK
jgi:tRNA modification GTPase